MRRTAFIGMFVFILPAVSWGQEAPRDEVLLLSKRIDQVIAARWKDAGITPAPASDPSSYYRRVNLDLVGRIPNLLDARDYIDDDRPDKQWIWVEKLIESDGYARHFATMWRGLIANNNNPQNQFYIPGFENWLRERMKTNQPYDQVVRDILTADASGMYRGGGMQGNSSPIAFYLGNENKPENLAAATTRVFLGVKLECAQCHAHPFAKWTRDQFWEFAAFYSGVNPNMAFRNQQQPVNVNFGKAEIQIPGTQKVVKAKFLNGKEPKFEGKEDPRQVLADWVTASDNPYFAKATADHLWSYFFGVGLLEPIMEQNDSVDVVTHPELLDLLAKELVAHKFDLKYLIRAIVHTDAYRRSSKGEGHLQDHQYFARMPVRGLSPEQLFDSFAEAADYRTQEDQNVMYRPAFNQNRTPRAEFLNRFQSTERRHETQTSILQALFLMNGKLVHERTRLDTNDSLRVLAHSRDAAPRKLETLYLMVLSRLPRADEVEKLSRFAEECAAKGEGPRAWSDIYWALLNSGEFRLNH